MKRTVKVVQFIEVEIDEAKFDDDFLTAFSKSDSTVKTVEDHIVFLATLYAKGVIGGWDDEFVENYGELRDMGIKLKEIGSDSVLEVEL